MGFLNKLADIASAVSSGDKDSIANTAESLLTGFATLPKNPAKSKAVSKVAELPNDEVTQPAQPAPEGAMVISSVAGMENWLKTLTPEASPAAAQALQSQINVLNFIQSPAMSGMAIDSMLMCLEKALKLSTTEQQKEESREMFAMMIHNLMFFSEARLRYVADQNKQEASQLLAEAGNMLAKSVFGVAGMALTGGVSAAAIGKVVIKNVTSSSEFQSGFFGNLAAWLNNRALIQEKKAEFTQALKDLFANMDSYSGLIGTSILVHGMLARYSNQLLTEYKIEKYAPLKKRILANSDLYTSGTSALQVISSVKKDIVCDYEYISNLVSTAAADCVAATKKIADTEAKINDLKMQISSLSIFQMSKKSDLKYECEILEMSLDTYKTNLEDAKDRKLAIEALLQDAEVIKLDVDAYAAHLKSVTDKFRSY